MSKIIVFTDLHLTLSRRTDRPDSRERLRTGLDHAIRNNPDADLVVLCGDLTDRGDAPSYAALRELLDAAPVPVAPMLGNHDDRQNYASVFGCAGFDSGGFLQRTVDVPEARLVFLDTLLGPPNDRPGAMDGELCAVRLAWLERQLAAAGGKPCVVFMHHPPHDIGFAAIDAHKLRNGPAFYNVIERAGNVRHIVCGHVHRTISGSCRGVPFSIFKSMGPQMPLMFEAIEFRVEAHEPAAYGVVLLRPDAILVHTEDFELTDPDHIRREARSRAAAS